MVELEQQKPKVTPEPTDQELVVLAKGDAEQFGLIMQRYWNQLFGFVRRMSYFSQEDIEDILQEVFLKTYRYLNDYDKHLAFSTWIYKITRNTMIDEIRKRQARPKDVWLEAEEWKNLFVDKLDLEENLKQKLTVEEVKNVLESLPSDYKEVLILRFWEQREYEEIMDIVQKPKGTVASLIARGRKRLLNKIKKDLVK